MKNNRIEARLDELTYNKFLNKANDLNLSITKFIEKIANEPVIFVDKNSRKLIKEYISKDES